MIKEAIVLAGGLGTRLKGVISDIPKPMAPIGDKPFLHYLLQYLKKEGVERVILAVGYKWEVIEDYFGRTFLGMELVYAVEHTPMGTGGGIANALKHTQSKEVFLLNGDTFFSVNLKTLYLFHTKNKADLSLSLKELSHFNRYGTVELAGEKVLRFKEKMEVDRGFINGGVYVISRTLFEQPGLGERFSFETEIMEKGVETLRVFGLASEGYFIDIGIPDDYAKANVDLPGLLNTD